MIIKIKPLDKLIIGSGKPFNAGENFFRRIDNIILNTYIYPIIKNSSGILRFLGFVSKYEDLFLPFPKDYFYRLTSNNILIPKVKDKFDDFDFIILPTIKNYLLNNEEYKKISKNVSKFTYKNIYKKERNIGIEIDRTTKNTKLSKLYFQESIYLLEDENIEILLFLDIENKNNLKNFYIFAGEGKITLVNIHDSKIMRLNELINLDKKIIKKLKDKKTKHFKIILLTPTNYPPKIEGAERIAQLTGKPIAFSGWFNVYDENENKKLDSFPSRLFKLIPAGSVFYYKLEDESKLEEIFEKYWLKPSFFVTEYPYFEKTEDGINPLGFGLSIIGVAQVEE